MCVEKLCITQDFETLNYLFDKTFDRDLERVKIVLEELGVSVALNDHVDHVDHGIVSKCARVSETFSFFFGTI